jgi:excisionase family DNA binding protein
MDYAKLSRDGYDHTEKKLTLSVDEVAKELGLSRNTAFSRVRDGTIPAVKCGRRWLIPRKRLQDYLNGEAGNNRDGEH